MSEIRKATIRLFNVVGEKRGREILRELGSLVEAGELDEVIKRLQKDMKKK